MRSPKSRCSSVPAPFSLPPIKQKSATWVGWANHAVYLHCIFLGKPQYYRPAPFGGAWSKFYLAYGALEAGQLALVAALMISSLLNVYYLLSIPFRGFFGRPPETPGHYSRPQSDGEIHEAPIPCLIAISVSTVGCVVLFFYTDPLYNLLKQIILP